MALTAEARPAPRPRPAPRAPRAAPVPAGALGRLRVRADRLVRHPAGIVGGVLALGAVAAVAANALSFQSGRHPAPLFAKAPPTKTLPTAEPAATARAEARADAPKPSQPDGIGALIRGEDHPAAGPKTAPAKAAAKAAPAKEASAKDAPAKEGAGKGAPPAHPPAPVREARAPESVKPEPVRATALHAAPPAAGPKPDKSVAYAQRALVKLGYGPLTVDGVAGPTTRAALARFERERRLPGASVARRTLQELEARSGLKPE